MPTDHDLYIHWFRRDLRLDDNPALIAACEKGQVLPLFILDDDSAPAEFVLGGASRWWLHHSLIDLNEQLDGRLVVRSGDPLKIIEQFVETDDVRGVHWNRCYEPWFIKRDSQIKSRLNELGVEAQSFNGSLLWEPWEVNKSDGTPYRVFTPFYRKGCLNMEPPREPVGSVADADWHAGNDETVSIDDLNLLPTPRWDQGFAKTWDTLWEVGAEGAKKALQKFLQNGVNQYKEGRNFPAIEATSRLSPHLAFGEISAHQIWQAVATLPSDKNTDHFRSELGWREFSYYLLYHFPNIPSENFQSKFNHFPWQFNAEWFDAWKAGKTGVPMVDAGMRELWQTGYMHNRVRMIVGSYLVKNLQIHWHKGAHWFWDCLADADMANNSASWQWVAGSGADAAPYFRIFNPVTQGQKFDPDGTYIRQYIPELAGLSDKYIHQPWEAPAPLLQQAGIDLGTTYPRPIVDLKESRESALAAFKSISPAEEPA